MLSAQVASLEHSGFSLRLVLLDGTHYRIYSILCSNDGQRTSNVLYGLRLLKCKCRPIK